MESFYSYRHANRLFTSVNGESINAFSNKIRIRKSAELLKYSSVSISHIAYDVGYESVAAFSKAFKKVYGESPATYRESTNIGQQLKESEIKRSEYTISNFENWELQAVKIIINDDLSEADFYDNTIDYIKQSSAQSSDWMLIWDEDPELSVVTESRYFIAIPSDEQVDNQLPTSEMFPISGRYAVFSAEVFADYPYDLWHELALLVLDIDNKVIRDAPVIDWLTTAEYENSQIFPPVKIGIPID